MRLATAAVLAVCACAVQIQSAAAAESCGADGRICVLADLSLPQLVGSTLTVRAPTEATELVGTGIWNDRLIAPGQSGGASLWQVECCPHAGSNVLRLWAQSSTAGTFATAEFAVQAINFARPAKIKVRREGRWLAARWAFKARVASRAVFGLQVYGPKPIVIGGKKRPPAIPLAHPRRRVVTAAAGKTAHAVVRLPLRGIHRICAKQPYCQWTTEQKVRRVDNGTILPGSLIAHFGPREPPTFFVP